MTTRALERLSTVVQDELWQRAGKEAEREREVQAKRDAVTVVSRRLIHQYIRCGKPNCHCANGGERHGPYTYEVITTKDGQSIKKYKGRAA